MAISSEIAIHTFCAFCHANCGIIAYTTNGKLTRVKADPDFPASRGFICPKGAATKQVVYSPERLTHPLRRKNGGFQQISWDEALDIVATRLLEIREKYGAETLVRCSGAPMTQAAREGFVQLTMAYGSANIAGAGHLCHAPRSIADRATYGGMRSADYKNTRCLLVWGSNPTDSRDYGAAYGNTSQLISDIKRRGDKLIVIDPRHIDLVDIADKWLAIEPGTDYALVLAILNVIINEKLYDEEFVTRWTTGFNELTKHVDRFTPEWAERITKIGASDIREVARIYATTKPASIREGNFTDQYPNAVQTARAIGILTAITGNVDNKGGNVLFPGPRLSPLISNPPTVKRMSADQYPLFNEIPVPYLIDAIFTERPYRPRAMIVHHGNPALINAQGTRTKEGLRQLDFLVVCDTFMTATAELADIILPDTSGLERYDFIGYASAEGGYIALGHKVIEPVGESRPVFDIEYELAKRMGLESAYNWTDTEGWINYRFKSHGITLKDLKEKSVIYLTPPLEYQSYRKNGFRTPSGKVELYSQTFLDNGYSPLPEFKEVDKAFTHQPDLLETFPLIGTTRKPGIFTHTRFRNIPSLKKKEPEPLIRINSSDAQRRGIKDGELTRVTSLKGKVEVKAKVNNEVMPGVVVIDYGWGNPGDGGANVNMLTSDEERDPISGSTSNRRFRCQVTKCSN
jgi:anaerobic selenocysteine-containing dehydrogenase